MAVQTLTTVNTAATATALRFATLAQARILIHGTTPADDDFLNLQIGWASQAIRNFCNRVLAVETVTDEYWPDRDGYQWVVVGGLSPIQLTRFPVTSAPVVIEDGVPLTEGADYRVAYDRGHLIRLDSAGYPTRWSAVPVSAKYLAGYDPMADDIVDATIRMVKAAWFARKRDPYLRQKTVDGIGSKSWWVSSGPGGGNMPPDVVDLLDNYRVPVFA
ncbi:MAG: hypothetical protein HXX10_07650 [Rhodoplanes sp.]|uniref:hypothetical protein n=1 Tax=Rhodoplanes sp. TaxID=1968906 RepID=UPI00183118C9|nr:hypothetical protein [Rhodoplanes sp.]NVO13895.1 hypothetical protein [Rhodoplanes sp.]